MSPRAGWIMAGLMVLAAFLVAGLVAQALAPAPSGPALSSYSTSADGVAGWAQLLERAGHRVTQLRGPLSGARLRPDATLVVLASGQATPASTSTARDLDAFVRSGGWLVVSVGAGEGSHRVGRGLVELVADPSFLENRRLGQGDNALRALELAGPPSRTVEFDEGIHGFGLATGFAAFPARWWVAIALFGLAGGAWILSRWMTLGGADPLAPPAPSPRAAYVTALAGALVRTRERSELEELARAARERERQFERSV